MKRFLSILLLFSYSLANIGPQGFKEFKNRYFVETGTFCGDAVARALSEGFFVQ